jgi:hypothetical protein
MGQWESGNFPIGSRNKGTFEFGEDRHTPAVLRTSSYIRKFPTLLNTPYDSHMFGLESESPGTSAAEITYSFIRAESRSIKG